MSLHDTPFEARMVEMNWFLRIFPVTTLYESTGIPKRNSEDSELPVRRAALSEITDVLPECSDVLSEVNAMLSEGTIGPEPLLDT